MCLEIKSQKRGRPRKINIEDEKMVVALARQQKSAVEIATELKVSHDTVLRVLAKHGIKLPHGGKRQNAGRNNKNEICSSNSREKLVVLLETATGRIYETVNLVDISSCVPETMRRIFISNIEEVDAKKTDDEIENKVKKRIKNKLNQLIKKINELQIEIENEAENVFKTIDTIPVSLLEKKYFELIGELILYLKNIKIPADMEDTKTGEVGENEDNKDIIEDIAIIYEKPGLPIELQLKNKAEIDTKTLVHMCRSVYSLTNNPVWDATLTKLLQPELWKVDENARGRDLKDYVHLPELIVTTGNFKKKKCSKNEETKNPLPAPASA